MLSYLGEISTFDQLSKRYFDVDKAHPALSGATTHLPVYEHEFRNSSLPVIYPYEPVLQFARVELGRQFGDPILARFLHFEHISLPLVREQGPVGGTFRVHHRLPGAHDGVSIFLQIYWHLSARYHCPLPNELNPQPETKNLNHTIRFHALENGNSSRDITFFLLFLRYLCAPNAAQNYEEKYLSFLDIEAILAERHTMVRDFFFSCAATAAAASNYTKECVVAVRDFPSNNNVLTVHWSPRIHKTKSKNGKRMVHQHTRPFRQHGQLSGGDVHLLALSRSHLDSSRAHYAEWKECCKCQKARIQWNFLLFFENAANHS